MCLGRVEHKKDFVERFFFVIFGLNFYFHRSSADLLKNTTKKNLPQSDKKRVFSNIDIEKYRLLFLSQESANFWKIWKTILYSMDVTYLMGNLFSLPSLDYQTLLNWFLLPFLNGAATIYLRLTFSSCCCFSLVYLVFALSHDPTLNDIKEKTSIKWIVIYNMYR